MKASTQLMNEDVNSPYEGCVYYDFKAPGVLSGWDENGNHIEKEILLNFIAKKSGEQYMITTSSSLVFFAANRFAAGESGPLEWNIDYGDNSYIK